MNPRTTGILLLVALALGAFLYFYEYQAGEGWRELEATGERLFPGLEAEAVDWIALTTSDERAARLVRAERGWRVVEPLAFPADDVAADGMASALADLESEGAIEDPQPPEVYGLGEKAPSVRFHAGEGEYELRIGKKTPLGANTYAATAASDRIFTVPTFRVNALRRSLDDLRERRPLRFDRAALQRIEASWPDGGVVLGKREGSWQLLEPLEARADESTVETLLSDLAFLRASGFIDEPPPDAEVGLDRPAFRVVLVGRAVEEGDPPRFELAIGKSRDGKRAVRGAEPSLYEIPADRIEDLPRRVVAYRFKELGRFLASDAKRVELEFRGEGAAEAALTVEAEHGDAGWSARPEPMEPDKVASLVAELARLRADDIAAEAMSAAERAEVGLEPPRVAIRVYGVPDEAGEAPKLAEVALGRLDAKRGLFARVPGRETVYLLAADLAEHLPADLEAFRNRFVASEAEDAGDEDAGEAEWSEEPAEPELSED